MFIIDVEGTDGSGKATQTKLLYNNLTEMGYRCKILSFPNYDSPSSAPVKMYLGGELGENVDVSAYQASVLFAVDRFITINQAALDDFDFVILDRYTYSNMVHQSTKFKTAQEMEKFLQWVENFEFGLLNLPKPNLVLFLDVPVEVSFRLAHERASLKNGQKTDILENDFSHLKSAYNNAKYIAKKFNWQTIDCEDKGKIKSIEEISNLVLTAVENAVKTQNLKG